MKYFKIDIWITYSGSSETVSVPENVIEYFAWYILDSFCFFKYPGQYLETKEYKCVQVAARPNEDDVFK